MLDFKEISSDGEDWELFSRDFLEEMGFFIESPPDRGADGGKDMLITEEIKGKLHRDRFRWLVSCKHYAHSGKSVNENDHEKNILERIKAFKADGFLGFYSTIPSSGLNTRLRQLRDEKEIRDYRIFDHKLIETHLLLQGFSRTILRYFPESYKRIRPLHNITDKYVPLECRNCGKDLLNALYHEGRTALMAQFHKDNGATTHILDTYFACKGDCDKQIDDMAYELHGATTAWRDIYDLATPMGYLELIFRIIDDLFSDAYVYSDKALKNEKLLLHALAQKVFREVTEAERSGFF